MLGPEGLAASITAIAIAFSQGRSSNELALMGALLNQLGDTLSTISIQKGIIEDIQSQSESTNTDSKQQDDNNYSTLDNQMKKDSG